MDTKIPSPKELDSQSNIRIEEWLDLDSERWKEIDDNPALTKKWLIMLTKDPAFILTDLDGRCWVRNDDTGKWHPYHLEHNNKLYGIRLPTKAAN